MYHFSTPITHYSLVNIQLFFHHFFFGSQFAVLAPMGSPPQAQNKSPARNIFPYELSQSLSRCLFSCSYNFLVLAMAKVQLWSSLLAIFLLVATGKLRSLIA
jgi:hypothetical protein